MISKKAKLASFIAVIALLILILAGTVYYENNITAMAVRENFASEPSIQIKEISSINELSQLNEGWYEVRNGHVLYLEHFDTAIPLYIKINNPPNLNMLFVVDNNGNINIKGIKNSDRK